jgi:hypothetical protein
MNVQSQRCSQALQHEDVIGSDPTEVSLFLDLSDSDIGTATPVNTSNSCSHTCLDSRFGDSSVQDVIKATLGVIKGTFRSNE